MVDAQLLDSGIVKRIALIAPSLPAAQRRLAKYVLDNTFLVASRSIESLAEATGVSIATANRFAVALGYSGFAEFRQALFQVFSPSLEPVEKLRIDLSRDSSPNEVVANSFACTIQALEQTIKQLAVSDIERALNMLLSSRNVFCLGLGTSSLLAEIAAFRFAPYCQNIHGLASHGGAEMVLHQLQKIGQPDLLFAIAFPRYSADIVRIMRFAKERGASTLCLTDRPSSPLIPLSDHSLFAQAEHPTLSGSQVPALAIIEALTAAMTHRDPESLEKAEELTRQLVPYFHVDAEMSTPASGTDKQTASASKKQRKTKR